jgi:hypothetical protein
VSQTVSEGLEVGATAKLTVALNSVASEMRAQREQQRLLSTVIRQIPFAGQIPLTAGAGTLQSQPNMGVPQSFYGSIRRLSAVGFSAGTVTPYIDNVNGEPIPPFPQAGVFTFSKGEILLHPMSQLVVSATGITGTVTIYGAMDLIEAWFLPTYLA